MRLKWQIDQILFHLGVLLMCSPILGSPTSNLLSNNIQTVKITSLARPVSWLWCCTLSECRPLPPKCLFSNTLTKPLKEKFKSEVALFPQHLTHWRGICAKTHRAILSTDEIVMVSSTKRSSLLSFGWLGTWFVDNTGYMFSPFHWTTIIWNISIFGSFFRMKYGLGIHY